jgi:hypothetical protein
MLPLYPLLPHLLLPPVRSLSFERVLMPPLGQREPTLSSRQLVENSAESGKLPFDNPLAEAPC